MSLPPAQDPSSPPGYGSSRTSRSSSAGLSSQSRARYTTRQAALAVTENGVPTALPAPSSFSNPLTSPTHPGR